MQGKGKWQCVCGTTCTASGRDYEQILTDWWEIHVESEPDVEHREVTDE